jgi:hypothetical protein
LPHELHATAGPLTGHFLSHWPRLSVATICPPNPRHRLCLASARIIDERMPTTMPRQWSLRLACHPQHVALVSAIFGHCPPLLIGRVCHHPTFIPNWPKSPCRDAHLGIFSLDCHSTPPVPAPRSRPPNPPPWLPPCIPLSPLGARAAYHRAHSTRWLLKPSSLPLLMNKPPKRLGSVQHTPLVLPVVYGMATYNTPCYRAPNHLH